MTAQSLKITTPSDTEIVITREFDAPRSKVWAAMTEPQLLQRWLSGPPGWTMTECENDLRAGGAFRHVWRDTSGTTMAMRGTNKEIQRPERVVRTETFEMGCEAQTGEQIGTMVLTEKAGPRTAMSLTIRYPSKEARDAALASGMEHGMNAGYANLDQLLAAGV